MLAIQTGFWPKANASNPALLSCTCLERQTCATLPAIGDFDQAIDIEIYCRAVLMYPALSHLLFKETYACFNLAVLIFLFYSGRRPHWQRH